MTSRGEEFAAPAKTGFKSDDAQHRRNWTNLEDFLASPFLDSAHIHDATIDTAHIADEAVTNAKIQTLSVDKLTAGELSADVLLSGNIKTAETGQRVEISSDGLKLTDGVTDKVNIPVNGTATFSGGITATGLDVTGNASLRGDANSLEVGAVLTLESGVSNPSAPATIAWSWNVISGDGTGDLARRGMTYDSGAAQFVVCSPTNVSVSGYSAGSGVRLWERRPLLRGPHSVRHFQPYGAVIVGAKMWVSARDDIDGATWLLSYTVTAGVPGVDLATWDNITTNIGASATLAGMTYNGIYPQIGWLSSANILNVTSINPATGNLISALALENSLPPRYSVYDIEYRSESSAHYWAMISDSVTSSYSVRVYSNVPARVISADFDVPSNSRGICHDGTRFFTMPPSTDQFRQHTNWVSASTYEHVAYTWYDAASPVETAVSPDISVSMNQRAKLRVSMPSRPLHSDSIQIYAVETSTTALPAAGDYHRQARITSSSTDLETYDSAGTADPIANTFPVSGASGEITASSTGPWLLKGDGTMGLPTSLTAPASPFEGQMFHNLTTHKAQVYDGSAWQNLF